MSGKLTNQTGGIRSSAGVALKVLTAEPAVADSSNWASYVGTGLPYMGIWAESDGIHINYNGVESTIATSISGGAIGTLDDIYTNGRTIALDAGAITLTDATTSTADCFDITVSGAKSGDVFDIGVDAAATGKVFNVDMNLGIAAECLYIDNGAGARTGSDIHVKSDSSGAHSVLDIDLEGSGAAVGLDIQGSYNGSPGGQAIKVTLDANDALDTEVLQVDTGAGNRGIMFDLNFGHADSGTSSHIFDIDVSGILDSNVIDVAYGAASTGNALAVNLDNAVGGTALYVEGSGVRTAPMIEVATDSTSSANIVDIDIDGIITGNVFDVELDAAMTGNVIDLDMNLGVASKAIYIDAGDGARTAALIDLKHDGSGNVSAINIDQTNTGSGNIIEIDVDAVHTGNAIDINYGTGAATGNAIAITTGTNLAGNALQITTAGARTAPVINVVGAGTDAGTDDHIILIKQSAVLDSNMVQLTYDTAASTGDALGITMGTNVAGSALAISGSGARTDDLIQIDDASTGNAQIFDINLTAAYTGNVIDVALGNTTVAPNVINISRGTGTNTGDAINIDDTGTSSGHEIDINVTGAATGNVLDVTYSVGASTGNCIDLNMGTNVAGMAIDVTSSATGTSGEGSILNSAHDGNLAAGADLIRIASTGSPSSTSNLVAIEQSTGAGSVGAYGLYVNCTGANVEAIKVDAGAVVLDETLDVAGATTLTSTLAVTGATTLSSTLGYRNLTEVVTSTNTITAAESGKIFFLSAENEFDSVLPAPAAGLNYKFIVSAAPADVNYTISTNSSANIIVGMVNSSSGGNADSETSGADTINFVAGTATKGDYVDIYCDGTNWYAYGFCDADAAITITTAG